MPPGSSLGGATPGPRGITGAPTGGTALSLAAGSPASDGTAIDAATAAIGAATTGTMGGIGKGTAGSPPSGGEAGPAAVSTASRSPSAALAGGKQVLEQASREKVQG